MFRLLFFQVHRYRPTTETILNAPALVARSWCCRGDPPIKEIPLDLLEGTVLRRAPRLRYCRHDLKASTVDAIGHGGMVGLGETYVPAFALALGMADSVSGLVTTLPMLVGGVVQLFAPYGVARVGSRRAWVVAFAILQALSFVPLILGAASGSMPRWALLVAVCCYWTASLSTAAPWNAWIDSLVPTRLRGPFFARRTRLSQFALVAGIVLAGLALDQAGPRDHVLTMFAFIFSLAGLGRTLSALALWSQREPNPPREQPREAPLVVAALETLRSGSRRTILFLWAMQASVYVSGPFFSAYMLMHLHLSYSQYLVLLSTGYLGKILALTYLGDFARKVGAKRLFRLGAAAVAPLPLLWLVSRDFWFLQAVQLLSGIAWAAFELGTLLVLFDVAPPERRTQTLAIVQCGYMAATAVGSIVGVLFLHSATNPLMGFAAIFVVSSLGRSFALAVFFRQPMPVSDSVELVETKVPPPSPVRTSLRWNTRQRSESPA